MCTVLTPLPSDLSVANEMPQSVEMAKVGFIRGPLLGTGSDIRAQRINE